jgi:hypothetical protein
MIKLIVIVAVYVVLNIFIGKVLAGCETIMVCDDKGCRHVIVCN